MGDQKKLSWRRTPHPFGDGVGAEVLKLVPCVDQPWAIPLTVKSPPWWKHWDILRALRRQRFDAAFNFAGSDRSLFAMAFIGAPCALAYEPGRKHFWNHWIRADWISSAHRVNCPSMSNGGSFWPRADFRYSRRVSIFRFPPSLRNGRKQPSQQNQSIFQSTPARRLRNGPWITGWNWQNACWAQINQFGWSPPPAPNRASRSDLTALAKSVDDPRLRCIERPEIAHLAAILQRCRLHIGADSGALHLAMALGVPTLTVFREYPGLQEWVPLRRPTSQLCGSLPVHCRKSG